MERQDEGRMSTDDIAAGRAEQPPPREGEHGAGAEHGAPPAQQGAGQGGAAGQQGGESFQPQSPAAPGPQAGYEQQAGGVAQGEAHGAGGGQGPQGAGAPQGGGHDPHGGGAPEGGVATQEPGAQQGATAGAVGGAGSAGATNGHAGGGSGDSALLADNDAREFERRWQDVQVGFVDEPQRCVQEADGLVAEVMQRLADGFARERKDLEAQWASGGEASTEDLRVALQRYRSFFNRLLETS